MTLLSWRMVSVLARSLCILALLVTLGCDDGDDPVAVGDDAAEVTEIEFDFVADREFPPDSNNRESLTEFEFTKSGITVYVTAADEDGKAVNVSRRGPGGLGVVGGGGLEPDGETTSGNRVNSGEMLILEIVDGAGDPVSAQLVEATFSRIKRFPDHPETRFEIIADDGGAFAVEFEGTLHPDSDEFVGREDEDGNIVLEIEDVDLFGDMFILTNGRPFHPTANRFRVGGITIRVDD